MSRYLGERSDICYLLCERLEREISQKSSLCSDLTSCQTTTQLSCFFMSRVKCADVQEVRMNLFVKEHRPTDARIACICTGPLSWVWASVITLCNIITSCFYVDSISVIDTKLLFHTELFVPCMRSLTQSCR